MSRDAAGEYAASRQPATQTYKRGDRVLVKASCRVGTVRRTFISARGNFAVVCLDGEGNKTQNFLMINLTRAESLF